MAPNPLQVLALVVEDEPLVRFVAVDALMDAGFQVIEAGDAAEALTSLQDAQPPCLLFTDVQMPGEMDGIGLAEDLVARYPGIKVIVTSALPLMRTVDHLGARFLPKPYRMDELCNVAKDLLADPAQVV